MLFSGESFQLSRILVGFLLARGPSQGEFAVFLRFWVANHVKSHANRASETSEGRRDEWLIWDTARFLVISDQSSGK